MPGAQIDPELINAVDRLLDEYVAKMRTFCFLLGIPSLFTIISLFLLAFAYVIQGSYSVPIIPFVFAVMALTSTTFFIYYLIRVVLVLIRISLDSITTSSVKTDFYTVEENLEFETVCRISKQSYRAVSIIIIAFIFWLIWALSRDLLRNIFSNITNAEGFDPSVPFDSFGSIVELILNWYTRSSVGSALVELESGQIFSIFETLWIVLLTYIMAKNTVVIIGKLINHVENPIESYYIINKYLIKEILLREDYRKRVYQFLFYFLLSAIISTYVYSVLIKTLLL